MKIQPLILFFSIFAMGGCDPEPHYIPLSVKGDTFAVPSDDPHISGDERILNVFVYHWNEKEKRTATNYITDWRIQAVKNIPVQSFEITVGVIPNGFVQVYPTLPGKPIFGQGIDYRIHIDTNKPRNILGAEWKIR